MAFTDSHVKNTPLYALVDPFFGEPPGFECPSAQQSTFEELAECRAQVWGRPVCVAAGESPLIEPHRLPYIVQLEAGDSLLAELGELARDQHQAALDGMTGAAYRLGTLIESDLSPKLLIERLQHMWTYRHRSQRRYLRLGDRRVMEFLFNVVKPESIANWLGPINRWHILGRNFKWVSANGSAHETTLSESEIYRRQAILAGATHREAHLKLDDGEHAMLLQSEAASLALTRLQQEDVVPDQTVYRRLPAAFEQAARYRFRTQQDSAFFVACIISDSQCLAREPMRSALGRYPKSTETLEDLLEQVVSGTVQIERTNQV